MIETNFTSDDRGAFVKVFHQPTFEAYGINDKISEAFYSNSQRDVLRGMHFQLPPMQCSKLVYVTRGSILDVVLDLRLGSPAYGSSVQFELAENDGKAVYVPPGCAHGFLSRQPETCVQYLQSAVYSPECDSGVRFDSFGFDWGISDPILSDRDRQLENFSDFKSPFIFEAAD